MHLMHENCDDYQVLLLYLTMKNESKSLDVFLRLYL
jgi:hypothetical protein